VVSTQVGGVPEVLPSDLIRLAEPNTSGYNMVVRSTWFWLLLMSIPGCTALVDVLEEAIEAHRCGSRLPHQEMHERVKRMYTWHNVAKRTEKVFAQLGNSCMVHYVTDLYRYTTWLPGLPRGATLRGPTGSTIVTHWLGNCTSSSLLSSNSSTFSSCGSDQLR